MTMRGSAPRIALVSLLALAACQWLVPLRGEPPESPDAGIDAGATDPCGPIVLTPPSPSVPDDAGGSPIVLGLYLWDYKKSDGQGSLCAEPGFNLDGLDTALPSCTPVSCSLPPGASATDACDDAEGRDDALATILDLMSTALSGGTESTQTFNPTVALQRGVMNLIIEVRNYGGGRDDPSVEVALWLSSGIAGVGQPDTLKYDALQAMPALWDGGQDVEWMIDETSVIRQGEWFVTPKVLSKGYVRDGVLVVPSTGPMELPSLSGSPLALRDAVFMGRLFQHEGRWTLTQGRIGATFDNASFLGLFGASRFASPEQLCERSNKKLYDLLRGSICSSLDLPPDGGAPNAAVPCGSLSAAFSVAAAETKIAYRTGGPNGVRVPLTGVSGGLHRTPPCPDDAGIWCDDCAWPAPRRCPLPAQ
jgi:hypothetical protein